MTKRKRQPRRPTTAGVIVCLVCGVLLAAASYLIDAFGGLYGLPGWEQLYAWLGIPMDTPSAEMLQTGDATVTFFDVGQGDSVLIACGEDTCLIDAGTPDAADSLVAALQTAGVRRLDYLVMTHPHADHIGGMAEIVQQFEIGQVLFAPLPDSLIPTTRTYEELLDAIAAKGLSITAASPGMTFSLGDGAQITILGPVGEFDDLNNASIVFRLDFGQTAFLFTGDAEAPSEDAILDRFGGEAVAAQVLKLGHHGSDTSSQEKWLNAVSPLLAVAEVGYDNSYGHPSPQTVERLDVREIPLLRTDQDGTIVVVSDGESLSVSTEK